MQLIVNYSEPTFKVENGIYNGEYPKSLFFVSRGQFSLSVSELTGQPKLTAFQLMAIEGKRFSDSSIIVDGVEYAIDYTDESTVAGTLEVMYLILSSAFNGQEAEVPNIFTFTTAPSLEDFATTLGISLIYPTKKGEVIAFWNKDYAIPDGAFTTAGLKEVKTLAANIGAGALLDNPSLVSIAANAVTVIQDTGITGCSSLSASSFLSVIEIQNAAFQNCSTVTEFIFPAIEIIIGSYVFQNCTSAKTFTFGANLTQLGATSGDEALFDGITGNTITVTIPIFFQTNDGGAMDGDLVYLDSNNTVTFNWI